MICFTDWITLSGKNDGKTAKLWSERDDLWPAGKKLKVRFKDRRIPPWYNDRCHYIHEDEILEIANEWHQCGVNAGKDVVPEFVRCGPDDISDILVKFIGK